MQHEEARLGRRASMLVLSAAAAAYAGRQPKLGDAEWMRRFREFVKAFNDFIITLNDNILDRGKWERLRSAWREIETE
jgi:hypothetical protein